MKKKILSVVIIMVLCITSFPVLTQATTNGKTCDDAIAWVKSKVGTSVGYDDGSGYYQCVEFIQAYYQYLGVSKAAGNGCDYATNALPSGWTRTKGGTPQKGDILVYSKYSDKVQKYGHVAIYESDSVLYDQDGSVKGATVKRENKNYRTYTYNYWGCIHPDFSGTSSSVSVSFTDWTNSNYTYIKDTDASVGMIITASGGSISKVGMDLYNSSLSKLGTVSQSYTNSKNYFKINEELGVKLTKGTKYYYKFYAVVGGKTYYSDLKNFTTTGLVKVTKITLNKNSATVTVGSSVQLTATVTPTDATDKSVTWSTGNKSIATVSSSGLVSAVGTGTVTIKATAKDGSGVSVSCTITCKAKSTRPGTPANVTGKAYSSNNTTIYNKITWDKVTGATGYRVYRKASTDKSYSTLCTTTKRYYTDKSVKPGITYTYKVKAYVKVGTKTTWSLASDAERVTAKVLTTSKIVGKAYTTCNKISWKKVEGATGYYVYRKASNGLLAQKIKTITSAGTTSYKDTTAKDGVTYTYHIRAYVKDVDNLAWSAVSDKVTLKTK